MNKRQDIAEDYLEKALSVMCQEMETHGRQKRFHRILSTLEQVVKKARNLIDPSIPPKPLIGMVGEIYLRSHRQSNQDLIKLLESHGGEMVNASIAEWINYVSYDNMLKAEREVVFALKKRDLKSRFGAIFKLAEQPHELTYQYFRMDQIYRRVRKHLPIHGDHRISRSEKQLDNDRLFSFKIGTEAG